MRAQGSGVCVSLVSHGHGEMVAQVAKQILACPEVTYLIITLNVPEPRFDLDDARLVWIDNQSPKGFGANHNAAFREVDAPLFCVLNPDIEILNNPFPALINALQTESAGLAVPLVINSLGQVQDSLRRFMTPWRMLRRVLKVSSGAYVVSPSSAPFQPEWAAGMFMLFRHEAFEDLQGFDERYFMYCEDADICTRLWMRGGSVVAVPEALVVHPAQRASHRNVRHLYWHLASMTRYLLRFTGRLPRVTT
jgi:N-acetylglucosaminyl-diphospho-decaprenol L-rhamnosyltransferase